MNVLLAMLGVAMVWIVFAHLLLGLGWLAGGWIRSAEAPPSSAPDTLVALWIGVAASIALLQLWNLAWPVWPGGSICILVIGTVGLALHRRWLIPTYRRLMSERSAAITFILLVAWLANRSIGPVTEFDSGLYHLSLVQWLATSRLPPGLANLQVRFSFNNASLLLAAALEFPQCRAASAHLLNGFLICLFLAQTVRSAFRVIRRELATPGFSQSAFDLALLPCFVQCMASADVASLSTDLQATIPCFVALSAAANMLLCRSREPRSDDRFPFVLLMLALAVCCKLSLATMGGGVVAVLLIDRASRAKADRIPARRIVLGGLVIAVALLAPWAWRGIVASGYLLAPSTAFSFNVPWRMPAATLQAQRLAIRSYARTGEMHHPLDHGIAWVGRWAYGYLRSDSKILVTLPAVLSVAGLIWLRRNGAIRRNRLLWLLAPPLAGVIVWLLFAPLARFGSPLFFVAWAIIFSAGSVRLLDPTRPRLQTFWLIVAASAAMPILNAVISKAANTHRGAADRTASLFDWPDTPSGIGDPPVPELYQQTTADGSLNVWLSRNGQVWDGPLPCTPIDDFDPLLSRYHSTWLGEGFCIRTATGQIQK